MRLDGGRLSVLSLFPACAFEGAGCGRLRFPSRVATPTPHVSPAEPPPGGVTPALATEWPPSGPGRGPSRPSVSGFLQGSGTASLGCSFASRSPVHVERAQGVSADDPREAGNIGKFPSGAARAPSGPPTVRLHSVWGGENVP